jgi:hypothetical protein
MKRWFIRNRGLALIVGAALLLSLAGPGLAAKPPKIKFDRDTWDFGKVKPGASLTYEFTFKNDGGTKLNIKSVETSCGCTAALVSANTVEPGQTGKIKVTFNVSGYSGPSTKFVYVDSDDPDQPRAQLKIMANVEVAPGPRIDLNPYAHEVGLLVEGEEVEAKLTLANKGELELQVDCNQKNAAFLAGGKPVVFPLRIAAGKDVALTLKMALQGRVGVLREYVVLRSNDPQRPSLTFSLNGYIVTKAELKELFNRHKDILK